MEIPVNLGGLCRQRHDLIEAFSSGKETKMGTWDIGSFSNDDALDWLSELGDAGDVGLLEEAFAAVIEQRGHLPEAADSAVAVAAAEVLAALLGNPMSDLPEDAVIWLPGKPEPDQDLVRQAQEAVRIVLRESELRELWEEADEYEAWRAVVDGLLVRLS